MAMTANGLSAAIKAALCANPDPETGIDPVSLAVDNAQLQAYCDRIASAIVAYITANAAVSVTVTGTAASVPPAAVTGTGTGGIT